MADKKQLKAELAEVEQAIRDLEDKHSAFAKKILSDAQARKAELQALLVGDGAIAQGAGAKAVAKGAVLVEGDFNGNLYIGATPDDDEQRLNIYCRWVMQSTSSLPLRGVDVGASDPTGEQKSMGLSNVYVDMETTTALVNAENTGKKSVFGTDVIAVQREQHALPVLQAAIQNRSLVLLGDPGGGKSTFVNFLAHCLAANTFEPDKKWLSHLPEWPKNESGVLPIVVILRDFARSHVEKTPSQAEPHHLLDFIRTRLQAQNLGFTLSALEKLLEQGRVIVLLDGLDEVPTQSLRIFVRDAVRAFIRRYDKSRFLVTCRVLSYQPPAKGKPDLRLNELPAFEIAPFDQKKIDSFVSAWYSELGRMGSVPIADVTVFTARLREAVRRPDLQRLASNPLLLTVMSLVHTHRGRLPDARALLYEETVDILLWRWEQIKLGGIKDAPRLRQYLLEAGRTDVDLKRVLWELAFAAHSMTKQGGPGQSLADISEHHILKALASLKCDETNPSGDLNWAKNLVELMKVRAGLLLERQPEIFTFPHRTFQEYLAGAYLASQANFSELVSDLAHKDMSQWREAILYAAGKLVYVNGDVAKPLALVAELCPADEQDTDIAWRLAWLAGDVLQEIGLKRVRDSAFGRDLLKRLQIRLEGLVSGGKIAPKERANAGNTLSALGDPRFDPDLWFLPKADHLGFIHIPAGKFRMGSDDNYDEEKPQHELELPYDYWLAQVPVTVAQYSVFVEASGYKTTDQDSLQGTANHPVVNVAWYDALEYARWLDARLKGLAKERVSEGSTSVFWQGLAGGKLQVTLPSEAEWEKAARGVDGRLYPWGDKFDPNKANTSETGIGSTSTVGAFPGGQSPYGLLDMSGNVWEWTRSILGKFEKNKHTTLFGYPYDDKDDREDLSKSDDFSRVLRGGAFYSNEDSARCAYRGRSDPNFRNGSVGFRVVLSPFFSH